MVDAEAWQKVGELFEAVTERQTHQRLDLLAEANPEIRREIESLLAHNQEGLLDRPLMHSQLSSVTHINVGATRRAYRIVGFWVRTCPHGPHRGTARFAISIESPLP